MRWAFDLASNGERPLGFAGAALRSIDRNAAAAVLAGISVPLIVLGPSGFQAALALALVLALPGRFGAASPTRAPAWLGGLALVLAFWTPSLLVSIDPRASLFLWARTAALVYGIAVIHALLAEDAARHDLFLKSFLAALVVMLAVAMLSLFLNSAPMVILRGAGRYHRDATNILKPAASVLLCALPVVAWAAWRLGGPRWTATAVAALLAFPFLAVATDSRAALAGLLLIALVVAFLAAWRYPRYWPAIAVAFLGAAGAITWFVVESWQKWTMREDSVAFLHLYLPVWMVGPHRQVIWRFVFERFLERPLFGWGIGAINQVPGATDIIPVVQGNYVPSHPHSWVMEILSETGLVGTLPLLALLAWWIWRLARQYVRDGALAPLALIAVLCGFFGAAAFNFSIWRVWWHLPAMLLVTAIVAAPPRPTRGMP